MKNITYKDILEMLDQDDEPCELLDFKKVDPEIKKYLKDKLSKLHINVLGYYDGSVFELMERGKLEGWCWETTESAIVFLNDDDYIERGNLHIGKYKSKYYHSWISFKYDDKEYVFDPCLNYICNKEDYIKEYNVDIMARVSGKDVKEELLKQFQLPKEEKYSKIIKLVFNDNYDKYIERVRLERKVTAPEDINTPLYRNPSRYIPTIEDGKIKELKVHYYIGW